MRLNVYFFERQAARERAAAKGALSDAAKRRHLELAVLYDKRAQEHCDA